MYGALVRLHRRGRLGKLSYVVEVHLRYVQVTVTARAESADLTVQI